MSDAARKLCIAHTESSLGWGGQEIRILDEAVGLRERGHRLHLLCPPQARIAEEARRRGIAVHPLAIARKGPRGLVAMARGLRALRPDVVNTHSSTDSWLAALAGRTLGPRLPIVRTRHISAPLRTSLPTRWLYRAASHVVTTGDALRAEVIASTGVAAERASSIPTGVDLSRFTPGDRAAARAALALPPRGFLVGIVATLRSWKGHKFLLDALASIPDPTLGLVIVGDGPGWQVLHQQVNALNLVGRVVFAGEQRDVVPWLRALDAFALPSYANEGVPQAIMQAMSCAIPVVTTDVGAIGEIAKAGMNAHIVPPRDAPALAAAILRLRDDPVERVRIAEAGRSTALGRFSREQMLDRMESVFLRATELGYS